MSLVKINSVKIANNPAKYTDDIELEVSFDVVEDLEEGMIVSLSFHTLLSIYLTPPLH